MEDKPTPRGEESNFIAFDKLKLRVAPNSQSHYANVAFVAASTQDIKIVFGRGRIGATVDDSWIESDLEVYMPPEAALRLTLLLGEKIAEHQKLKARTPDADVEPAKEG